MIKCAASKVLEIICDRVDGQILETGLICSDAIGVASTEGEEAKDTEFLSKVYDQVQFFKTATSEEIIDVGFNALTILSYSLPKRPGFEPRFIKVIDSCTAKIIAKDSCLLDCRLALFLGYYIDLLY